MNLRKTARHESGHASHFVRNGGVLDSISIMPDGDIRGITHGHFLDSGELVHPGTVEGAVRRVENYFAGGVAAGDSGGTEGDMKTVIFAIAWAAAYWPEMLCDATSILSMGTIDDPEVRRQFFEKHQHHFSLSKSDKKAISAISKALLKQKYLDGVDAVKSYGQLPEKAIPAIYHGNRSTAYAIDRCLELLKINLRTLSESWPANPQEAEAEKVAHEKTLKMTFDFHNLLEKLSHTDRPESVQSFTADEKH